ncbi:hypothetical protein [Paenibacillus macerans]|uniref:hypothetical protein n=1 Tax=Paenibacillus macerans TaxID=44252 RepID=UPI003D31749B
MKRTHHIAWMAASAALLVLVAGCGPAETQTLQDQVEETLGGAVASVQQSVQQSVELAAEDWQEDLTFKGVSHELSAAAPIGSAEELHLENAVGSLELKQGTSDQLVVKATVSAADKTSRKAKLEKLFEQSTVSVLNRGGQVEVLVHAKDEPNKNLWDWARKELQFSEFRIDYVVEVPAGIREFDVINHVGNLTASGLEGTYRLVGDVGSIEVADARIAGKSKIETATGSLNLEILAMETDSLLQAKADVGSITAVLDPALDCDLETSSGLGEITGAPKGSSERGGGGPQLSLETSIGSITVE